MLRSITLVVFCLSGLMGCSSPHTNSDTELKGYDRVSRIALLRGLVHTREELLDRLLTDSALKNPTMSGGELIRPGNPAQRALMTVYCDLLERGVVEGRNYAVCQTLSSATSRECSTAYYQQIAGLDSIQGRCASCIDRLQRCLSANH